MQREYMVRLDLCVLRIVQDKRGWIALGIRSELGRGENLLALSDSVRLDGEAYKTRFQKNRKGKARTFRQDLMRKEHIVGQGRRKK